MSSLPEDSYNTHHLQASGHYMSLPFIACPLPWLHGLGGGLAVILLLTRVRIPCPCSAVFWLVPIQAQEVSATQVESNPLLPSPNTHRRLNCLGWHPLWHDKFLMASNYVEDNKNPAMLRKVIFWNTWCNWYINNQHPEPFSFAYETILTKHLGHHRKNTYSTQV